MSTRPGTLPPELLDWLPAVAEAMRSIRAPRPATAGGWALAAELLEDLAQGRDPRARFDASKSTKRRDRIAELVLAELRKGATMPEAKRTVAAGERLDEKTVAKHLRAYSRELWQGGFTWRTDST